MKLPSVPWKNIAAIGGAVRISVVRINPMPPCCIAMLDMPSLKFSPNGLPSNQQLAQQRTAPEGTRYLGHHLHRNGCHRCQYRHREHRTYPV